MNYLQMVLASIGMRMDDKFTAVLEKQLEFVKTRTYDIRYPELKARQIIPVNNDVDPGAETIVYRQWDDFGMAIILSNHADDLPLIDAMVEEFTQRVVSIGAAYQWTIQELRRSAMAGASLDQRKAMAVRRAVEQKIENIAALGDVKTGLNGFAKHPNVTVLAAPTGDWANIATTAALILTDLNFMPTSIVTTNKETFIPDSLVMPIEQFNIIATKRNSTTGDTNVTVLEAWLGSNPWVTTVGTWNKLANADATDTGPRLVCYKNDPEVLTLEIPQEFEQMPPQAKNLSFVVPVHARIGGVIVYYPIAMAYMDGTGA